MNRIEIVHPNYIAQTWPVVEGWLDKAMSHAKGEYTLDQLKVNLMNGSDYLMLLIENQTIVAAVIYEWINYPNDRVAFVKALGGKTNTDFFNAMASTLKGQGATSLRGAAFESVARLWRQRYGFEEIYRIVERRL